METKHSVESEKAIEKYLVDECRKRDWICLKFDPPGSKGWPDRIVLPGYGYAFFIELKSKGEKPRPMQAVRLARLRAGKANVYVCDCKAKVDLALAMEDGFLAKYAAAWRRICTAQTVEWNKNKNGEV